MSEALFEVGQAVNWWRSVSSLLRERQDCFVVHQASFEDLSSRRKMPTSASFGTIASLTVACREREASVNGKYPMRNKLQELKSQCEKVLNELVDYMAARWPKKASRS